MKKFLLNKERVPANPPLEFAEKMVQEAMGASEVISTGGGSTIDVGKYIAFKLGIPHTAIPTTAGTGSEVTKFAVFTDNNRKITIEDEKLIPSNYILKPELLVSLPAIQTASGGMDALCQAIESYWSKNATDESRKYSVLAIDLVKENLVKSFLAPENLEYRQNMLMAANYSGRAINLTKTTVCHAISYPITMHYNIPHGLACSLSLAYFIKLNNFPLMHSYELEDLMLKLDINRQEILQDVDKELVAKEAFQSERINFNPVQVAKQDVINSLN